MLWNSFGQGLRDILTLSRNFENVRECKRREGKRREGKRREGKSR
jgi:hypothetical protein